MYWPTLQVTLEPHGPLKNNPWEAVSGANNAFGYIVRIWVTIPFSSMLSGWSLTNRQAMCWWRAGLSFLHMWRMGLRRKGRCNTATYRRSQNWYCSNRFLRSRPPHKAHPATDNCHLAYLISANYFTLQQRQNEQPLLVNCNCNCNRTFI